MCDFCIYYYSKDKDSVRKLFKIRNKTIEMNLLKKCIISIVLLSSVNFVQAQEGEVSLDFLSLPATTKGLALGGLTTTTIANDVALSLESPALFGKEQNGQLSFSYMNLMEDCHYGTIAYGREFGTHGAWSVGGRFLNYGKFDGRDRQGISTGAFTANEFMLQGAVSYELTDHVRAGVSVKGIYSAMAEYKRYGLAADVGLNYFSEENQHSIGLSVHNLGTIFTSHLPNSNYATPWDIRVGFTQKLSHAPFQIHLTAYHLRPKLAREFTPKDLSTGSKIFRHLLLGLEFVPNNNFWIALGFNPRLRQDLEEMKGSKFSGLSCGLGFNQANFRVALAVRAYDSSFWGLMATFSTDFGLFNRM